MPDITGYRVLTDEEIIEINELKSLGSQIEFAIARLRERPNTDQRWVSIGTTDMQTGLMALVRSIAQPDSF